MSKLFAVTVKLRRKLNQSIFHWPVAVVALTLLLTLVWVAALIWFLIALI